MSDFLHNLRTGKFKRQDRNNRTQGDSQHRSAQWRNENDNRRGVQRHSASNEQITALVGEKFNEIKVVLEAIVDNQKRLADAYASKVKAQERTADAMETIAMLLSRQAGIGSEPTAEKQPVIESEPVPNVTATEGEPDAKTLEIEHEQLLKNILEMRKEGLSYDNIAQRLETEGIPLISGRGKWRGPVVSKLCKEVDVN
ncbi:MAG: hypothetical protein KKH68_05025 [Proteobacteria bacterium]|nr:hypothetical protein [Pseudomonadota bacterium]